MNYAANAFHHGGQRDSENYDAYVAVRVPRAVHDKLKAEARETGAPVSFLIRKALFASLHGGEPCKSNPQPACGE